MQVLVIKPNLITKANILFLCANLLAWKHGKHIHDYEIRIGFKCNVVVESGLLKMEYNNCWLG